MAKSTVPNYCMLFVALPHNYAKVTTKALTSTITQTRLNMPVTDGSVTPF